MISNTTRSYGSVARIFHWLTALAVMGNIALGLWASGLPLDDVARKVQAFSWHKTLGITALALAVGRILWALTQPRPLPVHPDRRAETLLAEAVHWTLYAALILVPVTGWIEHAATDGYAPILWPLGQGLPLVPKSPALAMTMAAIHHALAWLIIGSVALHVLGALKHAAIDRDGVLARMLTGRAAGPDRAHLRHGAPVALAVLAVLGALAWGWITRPTDAPAQTRLAAAVSEWTVTEGRLGFEVRQMGSAVAGEFADWTAAIAFDPDSGTGHVTVTINMDSVTLGTVTDQAKGADFFDVANHATAVFDAEIAPEGDAHVARGTLRLAGDEAPVALPFTLEIADGVARMAGRTTLDRRDWAIGAGYADESTVGFEVVVDVDLEARR